LFRCDLDSPIDEQAINYMVSRRYNLLSHYLEDAYEQRNKHLVGQGPASTIDQPREPSLLDSLAHRSILTLIKAPTTNSQNRSSYSKPSGRVSKPASLAFALPYCEFISYREAKSSVYQLISMGSRTALKLAFAIYDKNRNGVVDEDDLLQMISLSRTYAFVEADIARIAKAMLSADGKAKNSPQASERTEKQASMDSGGSRKSKNRNRESKERSRESGVPSLFSPIKEESESEDDRQPA
jgi:hypothetical protein